LTVHSPAALDFCSTMMTRLYSRTLLIWISLAFLTISAAALDPNRQISQYAHTAWRIQDGFFTGTPQAITQTKDGYLWIGTEGGLVRFDGVRFVPWTAPDGKQLPSSRIHSLLGANDGSLWIGTTRGLANWDEVDLHNVSQSPAFIETIVQDSKGAIWITRSQVRDDTGPLCEVTGSTLRCHGSSDGIPFAYGQPLYRDALDNLWIGSSQGLCRWKTGGNTKAYIDSALSRVQGLAGVGAIAAGDDASLLVGMKRSGKGLGLQRLLQDGTWKDYVVAGMDSTAVEVSALLTDRNGGMWVGTGNRGIYRVHGGRADHFDSADGLSSDSVQGLYEDREGDLWVATSRGIDRFHETSVISFSIREGLTAEDADSVLAARDGTVFIGNTQALNVLRQGKLSAIGTKNGLPGRLITSLFEDHGGRLWVGVDDTLTAYEHGQFHVVSKPDGKPIGVVVALTEDIDHDIWAVTTQPALFRIQDVRVLEEIPPPRIPRVASLAADPKGGIWLGLSTGDLARYKQGKLEILPNRRSRNQPIRNLLADGEDAIWGASSDETFLWDKGKEQTLSSRNGLPCDDVYALANDNRGSLWLDTRCGFVVIGAAELNRWREHPDVQLNVKTLDGFDGAQPGLTNFHPEISTSPDGKLWFANENILQMVDPEHLDRNGIPPPVRVEQIVADRKKYSTRENVHLPVRTKDIEIDYTALSFVVPEKVHFRYKLEGHDSDWQDPQNRRQAFYTDLPPGNYRFRVIASNNDGVWNEAGAEVGFEVLPAFYQTAWFRILCVFATAGILGLIYVLRLRHLAARMQARFEERLEERERIARDLHDTLLQGIYSASLHFNLADARLPEDSPAKTAVKRGSELLRQVSQEGRNALRSLRSSEATSDGLEHALSRLPKEFSLPSGIDFQVAAEGQPRLLRPLIRDEAYLIAREALLNAFRHARATKIEVEIDYAPRHLRILVRDNGCGMESGLLRVGREGHWGLTGMRERAEKIGARLEVLSRTNAGTEVQLSVVGAVAFQDASTGQSWNWLTRLYPQRLRKNVKAPSEEQHK
jgi:signal transduction histidine kinase/ligand-binding sensor domain-containing protein